VVRLLEGVGASGVVLEDQKRPRKCGHLEGKQILELPEYVTKLKRVLAARRDLFVVARSDASDPQEIVRRVKAFAEAGADGLLVDGLQDPTQVTRLPEAGGRPFAFNQIAGGKSPPRRLRELEASGVSMVIYSTPCLFAAQAAIENAMQSLKARDGQLPGPEEGGVTLRQCNQLLEANVASRDRL
jgi:2-methylisocitrate lyase-like PEP mutase family enzyme